MNQAKPADRYAVVAVSLNVGSIVAAMIAGLVDWRFDDLSTLLLTAGFLANVAAGIMWLSAGVNQWSEGRGLAMASNALLTRGVRSYLSWSFACLGAIAGCSCRT